MSIVSHRPLRSYLAGGMVSSGRRYRAMTVRQRFASGSATTHAAPLEIEKA
jgi:hypothetical protein